MENGKTTATGLAQQRGWTSDVSNQNEIIESHSEHRIP
jgi:hypothetical protein